MFTIDTDNSITYHDTDGAAQAAVSARSRQVGTSAARHTRTFAVSGVSVQD